MSCFQALWHCLSSSVNWIGSLFNNWLPPSRLIIISRSIRHLSHSPYRLSCYNDIRMTLSMILSTYNRSASDVSNIALLASIAAHQLALITWSYRASRVDTPYNAITRCCSQCTNQEGLDCAPERRPLALKRDPALSVAKREQNDVIPIETNRASVASFIAK